MVWAQYFPIHILIAVKTRFVLHLEAYQVPSKNIAKLIKKRWEFIGVYTNFLYTFSVENLP